VEKYLAAKSAKRSFYDVKTHTKAATSPSKPTTVKAIDSPPKGLGEGAQKGPPSKRIVTKEPLLHPAGEKYNLPASEAANFVEAQPVTLKEGTKLYRVIDKDKPWTANGGYWTTDPLPASKAEWRSGYAVLEDWNNNGAHVEYTVPKDGLNGWIGDAASQSVENANGWQLSGGKEQLFIPDSRNTIPNGLTPKATSW